MAFYYFLPLSLLLSFQAFAVGVTELPKDIDWQTADPKKEGLIASPEAQVGGTIHSYFSSFPLTLRQVGPDSNGSFRGLMDDNDFGLVTMHPNTQKWLPSIASHWAFDKNGRTVFYKLDPSVTWSDGKKVTADDFLFTLAFYRSPHIVAPWYNQYYSDEMEAVQKFTDDKGAEIVAVTLPNPKPDLLYYTNIGPMPKHFYKLDKDFIKTYNWKPKPTTGPYYISKVKKGKTITFKRNAKWWGWEKDFYKNRYNIKKIQLQVIRDDNTAFEFFLKGKLDFFTMNFPDLWHERSKTKEFENGYIHKLWFYNDMPRSDYVLTLNKEAEIFKDKKVREALHYAMNVEKVITKVLRSDYQRLQGISRGFQGYTNSKIKARPFDIEKASALLDAAGWTKRGPDGIRIKDGRRLETTLIYRSSSFTNRVVVLREEAKKAGFDIKLQLMDASAGWKFLQEKKAELAMVGWSTFFRPQYFSLYHSSNAHKTQTNNLANVADPELDKLIESYRASTSEPERQELAKKIQKWVHDDAIQIPLFEVPYFRIGYWAWLQFPKPPATKHSDGFQMFGESTGGMMWMNPELKKTVKKASKSGKKLEAKTIIDESYKI